MDFEAMIRAELAKGVSMEDIAKRVGGVMNSIQADMDKKNSARQKNIDALEKTFWRNVKQGCLAPGDVAALAVLVFESKHPEWTGEDIEDFYNSAMKNIELLADMQGKQPLEMINVAIKSLTDRVENECGGDTAIKLKLKETDVDKVKRFLDSL